MDKRKQGFGAVYRRRDGRWEGQIRIRGGPRRSFYARTRKDAIHKLAEARWTLGQGLPVTSGAQPAQGLLHLLADRQPGAPPARHVLHRALSHAMHWGLTGRNPAQLVSPPRPGRREMTALSGAQFQRLLARTQGSRWHPLWVLIGSTGLRKGEALGLGWQDVDLEARKLIVRRALQRQPGIGVVFVPPKSAKSRRTVYLSELACGALRAQRRSQELCRLKAEDWLDSGLVFTDLKGYPLESGEVNRALTQELRQAGLPHIRVHDLRHTTASILLEAGTHPKIVQDLLGPSTIRLTLDTYSHLTPALHRQAAQTMDVVLTSQAGGMASAVWSGGKDSTMSRAGS
jgi:integrase